MQASCQQRACPKGAQQVVALGLACLWLLLWLRHRPGTFPGLMEEPLSLPGAPSELLAVPVATSDQSVLRYSIRSGGVAVSVLDAMQMLGEDPSAGQLGRLLTATITRCRFESALFFETPPVNAKTAALTDFEFVLFDAPGLAHVNADPGPFAKQISAAGTSAHPSLAAPRPESRPSPSYGTLETTCCRRQTLGPTS